MAKSVYSVVLSDEVVAEIDRLAYDEGTSRSKLIDRILAQYAGCDTQSSRMTDIFSCIEEMARPLRQFRLLMTPSDELFQLKSAVPYKYNPTVKYAVELYEGDGAAIGEVRVSVRTQSGALLEALHRFFLLWAGLEQKGFLQGGELEYAIDEGKYTRRLRPMPGAQSVQVGEAIAGYIRLFDRALQTYFDRLGDGQPAAERAAGAAFTRGLTHEVAQL